MKCEMTEDCPQKVTHIDDKGYIYCARHGEIRKAYRRCRKLSPKELKTIEAGSPITSYDSQEVK